MEDENHANCQNAKKFIEALGLCHTVITDEK